MLKDMQVLELYLLNSQLFNGEASRYVNLSEPRWRSYSCFVAPEGVYLEGAATQGREPSLNFFPMTSVARIVYKRAAPVTVKTGAAPVTVKTKAA